MSPFHDSLLPLYSRLRETGLPCFIGGSIAAMAFGEPRATIDIDMIVQASSADAATILTAFDDPRYHVPPHEVLVAALDRVADGSFQVLDRQTGLEGDFYVVGDDALLKYGLENAREVQLGSETVFLAPPNYIIAIKLRYYAMGEQEKHIQDIQSILRISADDVDKDLIAAWAREFGAEAAWVRCLSEVE